MIAANFDNLLFLLLVAVAVFFQFLAKKEPNWQRSDKANSDAANACANATPAEGVRRGPDSQIIGSPRPTSNLKTTSARGASDRYSAPPSCAGAAADFTAFTSKTREVAQARGNSERNFSAADCQGNGENGSTRLRSPGRTIADCAAADLQSTRGNVRGSDADNS